MAISKGLVIRNLMETSVLQMVDQICDEDERSANPKYLTETECRLDVACYVLNRIPQRYVSSARGQAHIEQNRSDDHQLFVDLVTLTHEGLRRVSSVRRPFYDGGSPDRSFSGCRFFLPTITGRMLNGLTFELVSDIDVELRLDDRALEMIDPRWQNPYRINQETAGTYLFWPAPPVAESDGVRRTFDLEIRVDSEDFEEFHHYVGIDATGTSENTGLIASVGEIRVPDLYLLPR